MRTTQGASGTESSGQSGYLESFFLQFAKGKVALPAVGALIFVGGCVFFLMELSAEDEFEGSAWDSFWVPLIMSFFAGLSTTIGGLVIFLMGESPSDLAMALVLGLAAGVMIAVCIFDFWLPAARTAWLDSDLSELAVRALWTGVGVLLFLGLSRLLDAHGHSQEEVTQRAATFGSAGEKSTTTARRHSGNEDENDLERDGVFHSSDSETELGSQALSSQQSVDEQGGETPQSPTGVRSFSSSPSLNDDADRQQEQRKQRRAAFEAAEEREALAEKKWRLALLMMITLTAHNFPEGAAVAFSALESRRLGYVRTSSCGLVVGGSSSSVRAGGLPCCFPVLCCDFCCCCCVCGCCNFLLKTNSASCAVAWAAV